MRITIFAIGTRGDVQPLIALGKGLQETGHTVSLVAGCNFAEWICSHALGFVPFVDMEALMKSEKGLAWTESRENLFRQLRLMRGHMRDLGREVVIPLLDEVASADMMIGGFLSETVVQSISEKHGIPYLNAMLQPYQPTRSSAASLLPVVARGDSLLNRWSGYLKNLLFWWAAAEMTNTLRTERLGLPAHSAWSYQYARSQAPTILGASRFVVPKPADWPTETTVTGYWFLDEVTTWRPPSALLDFLADGPPPIYLGFGSMAQREPQKTHALIVDALAQVETRAVVVSGWGTVNTVEPDPRIFVLPSAPHTWLFPRMAAVVHHGGAGTTAAALRAGKPTMIIPHMFDQPYWGRRVYELGVGVKPVPRHQVTAKTLASSLRQLLQDRSLQERAQALGEQICAEDGVSQAVEVINAFAERRGAHQRTRSYTGIDLHRQPA
jgi:sterol 3beta-glucosyltransferase